MDPAIRKILIIRLSSLGDILLATPLVRLLREKFPSAEIDFLVMNAYADLLLDNPHLTHVLRFDASTPISYLWQWRKRIRTNRYDIILDIHKNLRSRVMTFGIPGLSLFKTRLYRVRKNQLIRFLLVKFKINLYQRFYGGGIPVWEKYVRCVPALEVRPEDGRLDLVVPPAAGRVARTCRENLAGTGWDVTMAPGARHFTKRWPAEFYSRLIRLLFENHRYRTILLGSREDIPVIRVILDQVPAGSAVSVAGEFSILESAALIRNSRLLITNDSGLMHVGSAVGVPMVAIFGSTVRELGFFPAANRTEIMEVPGLYCRPCSHIGRAVCPEGHFRCMREISPEMVLRKIQGLQVLSDYPREERDPDRSNTPGWS